jgi:hypothetical protein
MARLRIKVAGLSWRGPAFLHLGRADDLAGRRSEAPEAGRLSELALDRSKIFGLGSSKPFGHSHIDT